MLKATKRNFTSLLKEGKKNIFIELHKQNYQKCTSQEIKISNM